LSKPSEWVQELLQEWINQIDSEATLNHLIGVINERKKKLMIKSKDQKIDELVATYRDLKQGETIWLMVPYSHETPPSNNRWKYHKLKFYHWQSRKKILWLEVPWIPESNETRYAPLYMVDIRHYQPSRTHPKIRRKHA
jgi:hypothetical protein